MQLTPRYGPDSVIVLDGDPAAIAEPLIRQRRRLAETLATFDDDQWAHPSRCEGWSNRDVIVHLDSTNMFWSFSISAGLGGRPTTFMATFDPVASPAQMVANAGPIANDEVLAKFVASNDAFLDLVGSLDNDGWTKLAEAPPGHISVSVVAHHALWDSWIHERDIMVPLGLDPARESDEIAACLRYAMALAPAVLGNDGSTRTGSLAVRATDPDVGFVASIGDQVAVSESRTDADLCLTGDAIGLVEAFSIRRNFDQPIAAEVQWMVTGLATIFESTAT